MLRMLAEYPRRLEALLLGQRDSLLEEEEVNQKQNDPQIGGNEEEKEGEMDDTEEQKAAGGHKKSENTAQGASTQAKKADEKKANGEHLLPQTPPACWKSKYLLPFFERHLQLEIPKAAPGGVFPNKTIMTSTHHQKVDASCPRPDFQRTPSWKTAL